MTTATGASPRGADLGVRPRRHLVRTLPVPWQRFGVLDAQARRRRSTNGTRPYPRRRGHRSRYSGPGTAGLETPAAGR